MTKVRNSPSQTYGIYSDAIARTPLPEERVHGGKCASSRFMCDTQSQLDGTLQDTGTEGELLKLSRREGRRVRRAISRTERRWKRSEALGGLPGVFTFRNLYRAGKKCCNGVRWKQSVQNFEHRLFSGTAARRRNVLQKKYRFSPYSHFLLRERGKIRPIDAPRIQDRQVEKVYTQKVLLPLYIPSMIWNNGASLPGKGFHFSMNQLKGDLHRHFRRYGKAGGILLTDAKKFFPSAYHKVILQTHERFITDKGLKKFGDNVVGTVPGDVGMPLGVEPSQAEMIAYPSLMDNYMKCQMGIHGYGHYMDDFYAIIPPGVDYRKVLHHMRGQATRCGFTLGTGKTRYVPLTKPFRYCKAKYILTDTGRVVTRANKTTEKRDKRKIRAFHAKLQRKEMTYEDVWTSSNGMFAYLSNYNEHNITLRLRRDFFRAFGFSCESIENFRIK